MFGCPTRAVGQQFAIVCAAEYELQVADGVGDRDPQSESILGLWNQGDRFGDDLAIGPRVRVVGVNEQCQCTAALHGHRGLGPDFALGERPAERFPLVPLLKAAVGQCRVSVGECSRSRLGWGLGSPHQGGQGHGFQRCRGGLEVLGVADVVGNGEVVDPPVGSRAVSEVEALEPEAERVEFFGVQPACPVDIDLEPSFFRTGGGVPRHRKVLPFSGSNEAFRVIVPAVVAVEEVTQDQSLPAWAMAQGQREASVAREGEVPVSCLAGLIRVDFGEELDRAA